MGEITGNWSKKELEEACVERGLSKKGGKDDLSTRLVSFQHEQARLYKEDPSQFKGSPEEPYIAKEEEDDSDDDGDKDDDGNADGNADGSDNGEGEEDDESDSSDEGDEIDPASEVSPEEAEKQFKREQIVRKGLRHVLMKLDDNEKKDGIPFDTIPSLLNTVVKGFTPELCGYGSLYRFLKNQQPKFCKV